ncbi:MAG TPA: hypothetical protein PKO15_10460 [Fibrobacteria bacterium]|nr:hypothetical protein [Fibrobacteria bacterium]HOX52250.1 hypothetical protein [Fibrobacteria bacterium]
MTCTGLRRWVPALAILLVLCGCETIGSDTDGSTSLPVGTWVRTDGYADETMVFSKDGSVSLDSLDLSGGLRYQGTWTGSTASGKAVWKEYAEPTSSGKWGVSKLLPKLVAAPFVIDAGTLVMTFPDGERRFAQPDTSEY